jgi:hypothetical protein
MPHFPYCIVVGILGLIVMFAFDGKLGRAGEIFFFAGLLAFLLTIGAK